MHNYFVDLQGAIKVGMNMYSPIFVHAGAKVFIAIIHGSDPPTNIRSMEMTFFHQAIR